MEHLPSEWKPLGLQFGPVPSFFLEELENGRFAVQWCITKCSISLLVLRLNVLCFFALKRTPFLVQFSALTLLLASYSPPYNPLLSLNPHPKLNQLSVFPLHFSFMMVSLLSRVFPHLSPSCCHDQCWPESSQIFSFTADLGVWFWCWPRSCSGVW